MAGRAPIDAHLRGPGGGLRTGRAHHGARLARRPDERPGRPSAVDRDHQPHGHGGRALSPRTTGPVRASPASGPQFGGLCPPRRRRGSRRPTGGRRHHDQRGARPRGHAPRLRTPVGRPHATSLQRSADTRRSSSASSRGRGRSRACDSRTGSATRGASCTGVPSPSWPTWPPAGPSLGREVRCGPRPTRCSITCSRHGRTDRGPRHRDRERRRPRPGAGEHP